MLRQELSGLPRTNEVRLPGQASPVITHPCTALSVATGGIPVIEGATDQCTISGITRGIAHLLMAAFEYFTCKCLGDGAALLNPHLTCTQ